MSKAYNRRQDRLALKKAREVIKKFFLEKRESELTARKFRKNLQKCSCHMCRNPRHSRITKGKEKLTIQERSALESKE